MPYIIETKQAGRAVQCGPGASYWIADSASRVAVATLEEARDRVHDLIGDTYATLPLDAEWNAQHNRATGLPESGGTIGPLPDGTVIEVMPVTRFQLGWEAGLIPADHPQLWKVDDLVSRFNIVQLSV